MVSKRRQIGMALTATVGVVSLLLGYPALAAKQRLTRLAQITPPAWVQTAYIDIGRARTGVPLTDLRAIVIHYVGNPATTAMNNRNYFAMDGTTVCSHFVVGLEGEIVQCLPLTERSAASNHRNRDTLSIEVCHPDESGKFNADTYRAVVRLTAWLCRQTGLDETAVIRHYDVTGKLCPLYYVEHEDAWNQLRRDIAAEIKKTS